MSKNEQPEKMTPGKPKGHKRGQKSAGSSPNTVVRFKPKQKSMAVRAQKMLGIKHFSEFVRLAVISHAKEVLDSSPPKRRRKTG